MINRKFLINFVINLIRYERRSRVVVISYLNNEARQVLFLDCNIFLNKL